MTRIISIRKFGMVALSAIAVVVGPSVGQTYTIVQEMPQPAAQNVEASYIRIISCDGSGENGSQFYIYQYDRGEGQANFRVIIPGYWAKPVGGSDLFSLDEAVRTACS